MRGADLPRKYADVAQLVELFLDKGPGVNKTSVVAGSSPAIGTTGPRGLDGNLYIV